MTQQVDIYGVFVPTLALLALGSLAIHQLVSRFLTKLGFYRVIWHRALFDLAFYVVLLGSSVLLLQRYA
ncbi:MAG: DUF1656 domain-containing protein [Azospirillum brasilense]|nr:MAG: DUF1656 domain-containing protein [Azospirillum brasilense]